MLPQASYWRHFDRNGNVANCLIGGCKKPAVSIAKQQSQGEAENRQYRVGENLKAINLFRNNIPFYLWGRGCGVGVQTKCRLYKIFNQNSTSIKKINFLSTIYNWLISIKFGFIGNKMCFYTQSIKSTPMKANKISNI